MFISSLWVVSGRASGGDAGGHGRLDRADEAGVHLPLGGGRFRSRRERNRERVSRTPNSSLYTYFPVPARTDARALTESGNPSPARRRFAAPGDLPRGGR